MDGKEIDYISSKEYNKLIRRYIEYLMHFSRISSTLSFEEWAPGEIKKLRDNEKAIQMEEKSFEELYKEDGHNWSRE